MLCHQAQRRLNDFQWRYSECSQDKELIEHLRECPRCYSLVQAEEALRRDLSLLQRAEPQRDLSLDAIRVNAEAFGSGKVRAASGRGSWFGRLVASVSRRRRRLAVAAIAVLVGFTVLVPFNFREQVGYQIAIEGVERTIALDNQKITSLLGALGMEKEKASTLLDSPGMSQVRLSVGECTETCRLTISDLKTEHDVNLMVKAIIDLGCCQIDDIVPIFRNESTSLLVLAARKLLS